MARKILLADDSVTAQNMGRRILTDAGYEVVTVNNGSAALKRLAEQRPDLIVLDVYMPGYGGLEVCQRIKENSETARIPVLLTVGKLEPFKPEEARRVKADSFIVKPFEASELLTALTKLEDKIVPQGGPLKPGRFAKALASIEAKAEEDGFGDKDTGWKDRLKVPTAGKHKAAEAEPVAETPAGNLAKVLERGEDFQPQDQKSGFERPLPAGLPADITPEEIAAITAAAASVEGKVVESKPEAAAPVAESKAEAVAESKVEEPVASFASVPVAEAEKPVEAPAAVAEVSVPVPEPVVSKAEEAAPAQVEAAQATEVRPQSVPAEPLHESELVAALASLAPTAESTPANGEGANAHAGFSGPRWMAEEVNLPADEATLVLEREMEKAYAAMAAAEAAASQGPVAVETMTAVAEIPAPPPVEAAAEAAPVRVEAAAVNAVATETVQPAAEPQQVPAASAVEAPVEAVAETKSEGPVPTGEAAYAAAAGAGPAPATVEAIAVEARQSSSAPAEAEAPAEAGQPARETELAAAWEHWKNIRETVVGQGVPAEIVDAAQAAGFKELRKPEAASAKPVEGEESASAASDSVASIVDSVLAELKPRLMEEIAKKMKK